jgi:uncharacterized protein YndB with AHSA1/START domain
MTMTSIAAPSVRSDEAQFQSEPGVLRWKTHFKSAPAAVYQALATAQGRESYWSESSQELDGIIHFEVPGGLSSQGRILERLAARRFVTEYFGWTVEFDLQPDGSGTGTDLSMTCRNMPEKDRMEIAAGWVSVLMAMKAAVDFGVDLRNHDEHRTWWQGYLDN